MSFHTMVRRFLIGCLFVFASHISWAEINVQQTKVIVRTIGHEFLLKLGDSTSRVLPIKEIDGRYVVEFERTFSFEPDLLQFTTLQVLESANILDTYLVEVHNCQLTEMVYSFQASLDSEKNMTPCQLRYLPEDCYAFYFTVIEGVEVQIVEAETASEPEGPESNLKSIFSIVFLALGSGLIFFYLKRKKNQKPSGDVIDIGQFQFDQKGMTLNLKAQSIELSSKESDLLFLLYSYKNKTLEREYILKVVWGDDGDYVGRTLDVFISKLRKKLEADASLKIVNIRGIGYRFVMN